MRYDRGSGIAMFYRVGILEKGTAMSDPTRYIVEIDETVRDLNYGSVEATVKEKVYDNGW